MRQNKKVEGEMAGNILLRSFSSSGYKLINILGDALPLLTFLSFILTAYIEKNIQNPLWEERFPGVLFRGKVILSRKL